MVALLNILSVELWGVYVTKELSCCLFYQVAIKIIDKSKLDSTNLAKENFIQLQNSKFSAQLIGMNTFCLNFFP